MSAAATRPSHLLYDPQETFEAFQSRQRGAYQAGKQAWRAGLVNGQALQLYDELVRAVGGNKFCWVKEETLAAHLGRSASTIKRWMSQLVQAGLIRRGRRFGQTSLTYIMAYRYDEPAEQVDQQDQLDMGSYPSREAAHQGQDLEDTCAPPAQADPSASTRDHTEHEHAQERQAAEAAACGELKNEPSISSFLSPHTYKDHHVKPGGGGTNARAQTAECTKETATTIRLQEVGVNDPGVLHELQERPLAEVDQVVRYVAGCRSTDDPRRPGLIVHLIRRGFGTRRRRRQHAVHDPPPVPPAAAPAPGGERQPATAPSPIAQDNDLARRWQQALDRLNAQLDPQTYETWIKPTQLLVLDGDQAVLGTPNVFVRDEVGQRYGAQIATALSESYGRQITLQVVIGTVL